MLRCFYKMYKFNKENTLNNLCCSDIHLGSDLYNSSEKRIIDHELCVYLYQFIYSFMQWRLL